jgi:hypothetical protein
MCLEVCRAAVDATSVVPVMPLPIAAACALHTRMRIRARIVPLINIRRDIDNERKYGHDPNS